MSDHKETKQTVREGASFANAKNASFNLFTVLAKTAILFSLPLAVTVGTANAASENMRFRAQLSAPNACTINVIRDGDFGVSANKRVLSSKIAGGLSAIADINSGAAYNISAIPVNYFTLGPSGASLNTAFEARFSGVDISRGRTFAERSGSLPMLLRTGVSITRVNVHMIATRTGSSFPGGEYEGTVVLRCE
jgi:hypothetical protein